MLTKKQAAFVAAIIEGKSAGAAYKDAFNPDTTNPDSLRALASRERQKPSVREAIEIGLTAIAAEAIQSAVWSERASVIARVRDIETIDMEIKRRLDGLRIELDGITSDHSLTEAEQKQRLGRAMQKALVGRDLINTKQAIYAALDVMTASKEGEGKTPMFLEILNKTLEAYPIDPNAYAAPPPVGGYHPGETE